MCPHGTAKCANCGGPHGARADAYAAKREARFSARGWRSSLPHREKLGEATEAPGDEATVAQGGEGVGETEVGEGIEPAPEEMEE